MIGKKTFDLANLLKIDANLLLDIHHHHDNQVTSFVFRDERPLDIAKVNRWFAYLVRFKGENLYRYKGVLHIKQSEKRVVFQGVHMLFAGTEGLVWEEHEKRESELVFIGKQLNYQELARGFQYCLA